MLESPLRRRQISILQTTSLFVLVAAMGLLSFAASELQWPSRHANSGLTRIVNAMHEWAYPPAGFSGFYRDAFRFYRKDSAIPSSTLFIGDSNMEQYAPRVDARISTHGQSANSAIFATRGGCLPIPHFYDNAEWLCRAKMQTTFDLAADSRIDTIVFSAVWAAIAANRNPVQRFRVPLRSCWHIGVEEKTICGSANA
jgi:SGNH domain (fused to AT3 domains)